MWAQMFRRFGSNVVKVRRCRLSCPGSDVVRPKMWNVRSVPATSECRPSNGADRSQACGLRCSDDSARMSLKLGDADSVVLAQTLSGPKCGTLGPYPPRRNVDRK